MADLPPELITSIYKHLDTPSSITALSSTCRKHHIILKSNAASIYKAAIYDNITGFSLTLELLEIQERVQGVDFNTSRPPTERLQEIQQEARNAVLKYETEGYRGLLSNGDYNTTNVRTKALVSIAEKARRVGELHTKGLFPNAAALQLHAGMSCERFISAFYRIWTLATLRMDEAMEERVRSIENGELKDTMALVPSLVIDCSDNEKIYLGVGLPGLKPEIDFPRIMYPNNLPNSKGPLVLIWAKAMLKISEAYGGLAGIIMANELRGNPRRIQTRWLKVPDHGNSVRLSWN